MTVKQVIGHAAFVGFAEFKHVYTLKTWLTGWMLRLVSQVVFFGLVGKMAGDHITAEYVLLGNAVTVIAIEATLVITTATLERFQGTYPMLIVSPTNMGLVYLGRGLHWVVAGLGSSVLVFALVWGLFRPDWNWRAAVAALPCLALIGISAYAYGTFLAACSLRHHKFRWLYLNFGFTLLMTFCGANVPRSFWPAPIEWATEVLPLTHGLTAMRTLAAAGPFSDVVGQLGLEVCVAGLWAALTLVFFERIAGKGRRDGSLNFTS
ncbi:MULTISPECIES: ABC transporter permease [Streptomyces]|uniref:ABC transporter permease n=1 Tax=Streptomyces yunnanensis TaxID=156453 RepID=A0ABY7ZYV6_9ACTN|nr:MULTISPECIES: ABC transporter permease [Streptomyces]AJC52655.1 putative ABC transporter transmembrane protein [Streptomyces sp. 769]AJC61884.1 putative ABC transporter transmembrane protein [Streptomyces sp. 769]WEB37900.1 ABC transporter permease [Streptomyces yunnanensis]